MSGIADAPKTKAEREAIFAQLFAGTAPADPPTIGVKQRIRAYRAEILKYHEMGYSWAQIQDKLKQPPLRIDAAIATIVKSVKAPAKKTAQRLPVVALPPRTATPANTPATSGSASGPTVKR